MTHPQFTLISHHLCPFVQRAAIVLLEKGVPFKRRDVDLSNKPDWFLKLSPSGKVPLLLIDNDSVLFESAVISEYIDEVTGGEFLPADPLEKALQRAWIEYASGLIANIGQLYRAETDDEFDTAHSALDTKLQTLDDNITGDRYFSGPDFSLPDAAFAPAFRYFDVFEPLLGIDFLAATEKVQKWRHALARRPSVQSAVSADYNARLTQFLAARDTVIGRLAKQSPIAIQ